MFLIIVIAIIAFIIYKIYDNHVNFRIEIDKNNKRTFVQNNLEIVYVNCSYLILGENNLTLDRKYLLYKSIRKYIEDTIDTSNTQLYTVTDVPVCKLSVQSYNCSHKKLHSGLLMENPNSYKDFALLSLGTSYDAYDIRLYRSKNCSIEFETITSFIFSELLHNKLNELRQANNPLLFN